MYKPAPNRIDQARIKKLMVQGVEPEKISKMLLIDLPSVKTWIEYFQSDEGGKVKYPASFTEKGGQDASGPGKVIPTL